MKKALIIMSLTLLASCGGDQMPVVQFPEIDTTNPLLAEWETPHKTPPFSQIKVEDYLPAFETAMACARAEVDAIVANPAKPTFKNTIVPLENKGALLGRISGVFFNLLEADATDSMQMIAEQIQPKMTELANDFSLNPELFERVKRVYEKPGRGLLDEDKRLLEEIYKGFARSGAALSDSDKELYRQYTTEEASLTLKFGQNSLTSTNAYTLNITDPAKISELPAFVKEAMAAEAKSRGQRGWTVTLQAPSYVAFMTYSSNRELKEQLNRAYTSRSMGGETDNLELAKRIANLRQKIANLLGYATSADYVLEDRMAESSDAVNNFLGEVLTAIKPYAVKDYQTVNSYADSLGFKGGKLMPWDWSYYAEKYKDSRYSLSDEVVKPYFKLENVQNGIFSLAHKLYGLNFILAKNIDVYHPDVTAYEVTDVDGNLVTVLYLDYFPRATKRSGAWMTEFRGAEIVGGVETRPLVSLVMNFTKPTETTPSLLTFDEMNTFLHEFGHALHGMHAKGTYEMLNGTNVKRDFVELPSQIMENWATEKEFLDLWAVHYQSGEPIPAEIVGRIAAAQNYLSAYLAVRQLSFAKTDMAWHSIITQPYQGDAVAFEISAMADAQILPLVEGTAMSPSFTHIFSGGYGAGYYGYMWAEVLAADAYSLFKERGIFNADVAKSFRDNILSKGNHEHPMTLYTKFRGHKPETKSLIDNMGLE